jgi:uncharacterized membrane protein
MLTEMNGNVTPVVNISEKSRMISGISGGLLLARGLLGFRKSSFRRAVRMAVGSWLIMRGLTGYCPLTALKNAAGEQPDQKMEPAEG